MPKVTDSMLANAAACRIRNVLDQVGSKWCLLVMLALQGRRRHFMDLKRTIGEITQRVLTQTLRNLERDGYVARKVYPTSPPNGGVLADGEGRIAVEADGKTGGVGEHAFR